MAHEMPKEVSYVLEVYDRKDRKGQPVHVLVSRTPVHLHPFTTLELVAADGHGASWTMRRVVTTIIDQPHRIIVKTEVHGSPTPLEPERLERLRQAAPGPETPYR